MILRLGGAGQVSTSQLAAGAVTNPKLAANSVTSTNIAHGAVSLTIAEEGGPAANVPPGATVGTHTVPCPTGSILSGGGFGVNPDLQIVFSGPGISTGEWLVEAHNPTSTTKTLVADAVCITITP